MKKNLIYALSVALFGFSACSDDAMDEVNKDNQHPMPENVPAYLQLTEGIVSTAFSTVSGDYAFYAATLTEQEIGVGNNQMMKAELRNPVELAASTTFNNVWNSTYSNLLNLRQMQDKVNNNVNGNVEHYDVLGIAYLLEAINFGILTDMHGDIPYSEALQGQGNLQPKLDSQKDIYAGIIKTLDLAIENLKPIVDGGYKTNNSGKQDLIFGGDAQKWLATAYAVKARYLLHQLPQNAGILSEVATAVANAEEYGFKGCALDIFDGNTTVNPWAAFYLSRTYTASSNTVYDLMKAYGDDPRAVYYNYKYLRNPTTGRYEDIFDTKEAYAPGDKEIAQVADGSISFPAWLNYGNNAIQLMSYAEFNFIKAEVQVRQGQDATEAYRAGVEAAVSEVLNIFGAEGAAEFAASLPANPGLKEIFQQKYLSQIVGEQVETYNDLRRCKALGEEWITLTNPQNTQNGQNRWPEVVPYGNSGVISNTNIKAAYGDGSYVYTKKNWVNKGE